MTLTEGAPPATAARARWLLGVRVAMLLASVVLLIVGPVLLFLNSEWTYKSSVTGDSQTARCRAGITAVIGGGTRSPYAYHAYDVDPSKEPDPTMRMVEQSVAANPGAFGKMWHEENAACVRDVRIGFVGGSLCLIVGMSLFVLRRRLPGRRRELRGADSGP